MNNSANIFTKSSDGTVHIITKYQAESIGGGCENSGLNYCKLKLAGSKSTNDQGPLQLAKS